MRRRGIVLGVLLTLAIVEHTIGKHSVVLLSRLATVLSNENEADVMTCQGAKNGDRVLRSRRHDLAYL